MTFTNTSQSFKTLNPHLGLQPNGTNALVKPTGTRRDIRKGMNKTERDFSLILAAQLVKGEISGWLYEGVKLKIGEGCFYTPDFMVLETTDSTFRDGHDFIQRVKFIEVKGFLRDDARVKFLAAQEQHKWASFEMWRKDKKFGWTQIL